MKLKHLSIILGLSCCYAFNAYAKPMQQLAVPFVNKAINSTDYEGLTFTYNMNANPIQKVVCTLSNFYKGWMDYSEGMAWRETATYGGSETVILTSRGKTGPITKSLDQYHADVNGEATIHHNDSSPTDSPAYASCFYMLDDNK